MIHVKPVDEDVAEAVCRFSDIHAPVILDGIKMDAHFMAAPCSCPCGCDKTLMAVFVRYRPTPLEIEKLREGAVVEVATLYGGPVWPQSVQVLPEIIDETNPYTTNTQG